MKRLSKLEETFALHIKEAKLIEPIREYAFAKPRRWRFDFAWPDQKLAVEIEGGVWTNGRHTRGSGFIADSEKYNTAALLGWKVLRFHGGAVKDGSAVNTIAPLVRKPTFSPGVI